jgi:hypothetical protein
MFGQFPPGWAGVAAPEDGAVLEPELGAVVEPDEGVVAEDDGVVVGLVAAYAAPPPASTAPAKLKPTSALRN